LERADNSRETPLPGRVAHANSLQLPEWAEQVLLTAPVAYVGMVDQDGPYVVPVTFTYAGGEILFHGGSGKKSEALERDPRVCIAVTAEAAFVQGKSACQDTFHYRSILIFGEARRLTTPSDATRALRLIVEKYEAAEAEARFEDRTLARTWVHAVRIQAFTCKTEPSPEVA
jgi:nitroimidazol reductase NimA-like FMN-containing flavoprotein (pyridoxamine 5'-phosphate oxidase superfamily)